MSFNLEKVPLCDKFCNEHPRHSLILLFKVGALSKWHSFQGGNLLFRRHKNVMLSFFNCFVGLFVRILVVFL